MITGYSSWEAFVNRGAIVTHAFVERGLFVGSSPSTQSKKSKKRGVRRGAL